MAELNVRLQEAKEESSHSQARFMKRVSNKYIYTGVSAFAVHPWNINLGLEHTTINPKDVRIRSLIGHTVCWLLAMRTGWPGGRYVRATWDMQDLC